MSIDAIAAIIFVLLLTIFVWKKRKEITLNKVVFPLLYVIMYRSSLGIKSMEKWASKLPRLTRLLGYVGVVLGFVGMIFILVTLFIATVALFSSPNSPAAIQPVLPIQADGVFFVPFAYWIISIFLIAIVHEFGHGILACAHKVKVKSSGFAFLSIFVPIIPAAFVEPDEKQVKKQSLKAQLSIFAAGPFSNFLFAILCMGLLLVSSPLADSAFEPKGAELTKVEGPALDAGLEKGNILISMNGTSIENISQISEVISQFSPGDEITLETKENQFILMLAGNPMNESNPYLGVGIKQHIEPNQIFVENYGLFTAQAIKWFYGLFAMLFLLNVGVGLFNLLPLGPLDGGRMFLAVAEKWLGKKGVRIWSFVSLLCFLMIGLNLVMSFIK